MYIVYIYVYEFILKYWTVSVRKCLENIHYVCVEFSDGDKADAYIYIYYIDEE